MRIIIENCVMEGWHPDGYPGNLAYSPELWEWMFSLGLYLNYDPSHLLWLGIDPVDGADAVRRPHPARAGQGRAARPARPGPVRLLRPHRGPRPTAGTAAGGATGCRACGDVDWRRLVDAFYEGGFTGVLSVEHEDPVWSGDVRRITQGLEIAHRTLRPLIVG